MQVEIRSKRDFVTSNWAGGTTTELFLLPQDGSYATRNFQARISSATVRLRESDFTALPGVVRYITPISGKFVLSHPDGTIKAMEPLDKPYRFDGGTPTHCSGTATDFNLMLKGAEGSMTILCGKQTYSGASLCCVYPIGGTSVLLDGKPLPAAQGDLAVIRLEPGELAVIESARAIVCTVQA